jgi:tetratricopeptide (TPR) repeat protein
MNYGVGEFPPRQVSRSCQGWAALVLALCGSHSGAAAQDSRSALDPITSAVIQHPITTASAAARDHFLRGQRELDLARFIDANAHFKAAVAADPAFAFAYLSVANTANSLEEFKTNLALAEQHAAGASVDGMGVPDPKAAKVAALTYAVGHLQQGNPFDPYIKYQLAVAAEGAGDAARAKKLFREVADYNFNAVGFALVRKDALQKANGTL